VVAGHDPEGLQVGGVGAGVVVELCPGDDDLVSPDHEGAGLAPVGSLLGSLRECQHDASDPSPGGRVTRRSPEIVPGPEGPGTTVGRHVRAGPEHRRSTVPPLHGGPRRADRDRLAGPLGAGRDVPRTQPEGAAVGGVRRRGGPGEALRPGHVPLSVRDRAARRPPAGLHRHRRLRPLPADVRPQRDPRHGLRRVRPAGGAVRGADRPAPPGDHRGQHRQHAPPAAAPGAGPRPPAVRGHHRRVLLPVDPVDLPADLRVLVRRRGRPGPPASRSWWPSSTPAPGSRPRAPTRPGDPGPTWTPWSDAGWSTPTASPTCTRPR
jgi:hypothetical protein